MSAKTYESLSDIFDITLKDNNYVNIANENAKTF
jgi:hypothetical protein